MKILAVSSSSELLAVLRDTLERLFPDAAVIHMTDPLMAGKYAFHNRVDILLAEADMKRMDGLQLIRFVRQEQPAVRAYLIERKSAAYAPLSALPEDAEGRITYPFSTGEVEALLDPACRARKGDAARAKCRKEDPL